MNTLHNDVFSAIADLASLATDLIVHESIILDYPLQTARKRTKVIRKGDMVRVMNMGDECHLIDCTDQLDPTHVILECKGTIYSGDLQIDCEDLDTQEIITVKL
jgi:hypothetical protein